MVEAAWFDPVAVRRTARRHGLHTDASHRFERGADFNAAPVASALVSSILLANGGWIEGELVDVRVAAIEARTANRKPVALALSEVRRILGATVDAEGITAATVEGVLTALGCGLAAASQRVSDGNAAWQVTLPSWRLDLEREIDLIEEVARVYGYNRFANTLPAFGEGVRAMPWAEKESEVRRTLLAAGFHEAIAQHLLFGGRGRVDRAAAGTGGSAGQSSQRRGRRAAAFAGAGNAGHDRRQSAPRCERRAALRAGHGFQRHHGKGGRAAGVGLWRGGQFAGAGGAARRADHRVSRPEGRGRAGAGAVPGAGSLLRPLSRRGGLTPAWLHPYRAARVRRGWRTVGWFGQLHPREAAARKLKEPVLVGEIYLDRLYKLPLRKPAAREISRFQPVRRDFSLVLDESIAWEKIDRALAGLRIPELVEWRVREVFRDAKLGEGEYSLLLGATFQAPTARCARRSCRAFRRGWWRLLAKLGRGCGVRRKKSA